MQRAINTYQYAPRLGSGLTKITHIRHKKRGGYMLAQKVKRKRPVQKRKAHKLAKGDIQYNPKTDSYTYRLWKHKVGAIDPRTGRRISKR